MEVEGGFGRFGVLDADRVEAEFGVLVNDKDAFVKLTNVVTP